MVCDGSVTHDVTAAAALLPLDSSVCTRNSMHEHFIMTNVDLERVASMADPWITGANKFRSVFFGLV